MHLVLKELKAKMQQNFISCVNFIFARTPGTVAGFAIICQGTIIDINFKDNIGGYISS